MEVDSESDEAMSGTGKADFASLLRLEKPIPAAARPRRRRLLLSTDSAFADFILPSWSEIPTSNCA
ncbi:phosphopentothenoylcysteine decarboxylase [Penicillium chermesinum]|nr:phosphopentothenoylcysteine decarboxylase [Penicillium chermesinum]